MPLAAEVNAIDTVEEVKIVRVEPDGLLICEDQLPDPEPDPANEIDDAPQAI